MTPSCTQSAQRLRTIRGFGDAEYGAEFAQAFAVIGLHYFINEGFPRYDGQVLAEAEKIRDVSRVIVHGRYDMICPVQNVARLAKVWRAAELHIIADIGHTSFEPGITDAPVRVTDTFRD